MVFYLKNLNMDPSDICFDIRLLSQGRDVMGDMIVDMMANNKVSDHWNILDKVVWAFLVVWDMEHTHMVCIHLS